ncbi:MAG: ycbK [Nitrospira sp.]|nr:ycbK [Nitrospira sp.]
MNNRSLEFRNRTESMATSGPSLWTRRDFLRTTAMGMAVAAIRLALPIDTWAARLPEGRVSFYNLQTDERLSITYRTDSGTYDQGALNDLNHLLRCHHTNESTIMDVRLIEFVSLVQRRIGGRRDVYVVSGYRSPEYNAQLIRMGTRAARNSYHVSGQAVDIQMPGVPLRMLREVALRVGCGGVGYYPRGKFVHLDSGPFRYW